MLEILFHDEDICIINKAPGHVVHKTRGAGDSPVILQALRDQIGKVVYPVHRLDRATSGCLTFALNSKTTSKLQEEFYVGSSIKKYTALCRGHLDSEGIFDRELSNEKKVKQTAITKYRVIQEFKNLSLLEIELLTGRKHQIRRHLAHAGHHIVGDINYGKGWLNRRLREENNFYRMFLHCHFLSFIHPNTGKRISLNCNLSDELENLLVKLKQ